MRRKGGMRRMWLLFTFLQTVSPGARCRRRKEMKAGLFFIDCKEGERERSGIQLRHVRA